MWRGRFAARGLAGLDDQPRSGRPKTIEDSRIIAATFEPPPAALAVTRWSSRLLARHPGIGDATVARAWRLPRAAVAAGNVQVLRPIPSALGGIRQWIESINDTFKGQFSLERHGGHTAEGVWTRVCQRILALAAGVCHNWQIGQPGRGFTAYDH